MKKVLPAIIFLVIIISRMYSCAAGEVYIWAIGDCHKIDPVSGRDFNPFVPKNISVRNYLWDKSSDTVTISGARNEYVSFQIVIEARSAVLNNVTVLFSDLSGPSAIPKTNIDLFKEHYVNVYKKSDWPLPSTGTGEYPDALIPFETPKYGAPFSIPKGRNQAVWVDLYIPKDALSGEYKGTFDVTVNETVEKSIKIELVVWDFTLPEGNNLIAWSNYENIDHSYGIGNGSKEYRDVEESIWKISHEHRLNALLRHAHIRPMVNFNEYGALQMDYRPYADRLGRYLDGGIFKDGLSPDIFLLPLSGGTEYRWPQQGPIHDPDATFSYACKDFAAYFREMGWADMLEKSYVYLTDEPEPDMIEKVIHDAQIVHEADKELKTMAALFKAFNKDTVDRLAGSIDMWLVDASYYDSKLLLPRKELGEKIGFYQQSEPWCGNENLDTDGLALRTWPWIAWKYNVDCIYLYHMTFWTWREDGKSIWEKPHNQTWSNSQGVLLYPGHYIGQQAVVGSIRLKQVRRGMQDYEYMYLARSKGKDPDNIVNSIIIKALDEATRPDGNYGEWSHDPEDWDTARKNLANLILGKELSRTKVKGIPKGAGRRKKNMDQLSWKGRIKETVKEALSYLPKKIRYPRLLFLGKPDYKCDFDDGKDNGWTGGEIESVPNGGYALKTRPTDKDFMALEIWQVFPVREKTRLELEYYSAGNDPLIVQFWSKTYNKNFSTQMFSIVKGEWTKIGIDLKDISPDLIDSEINSIHIATLNKQGNLFIVDNVKLK